MFVKLHGFPVLCEPPFINAFGMDLDNRGWTGRNHDHLRFTLVFAGLCSLLVRDAAASLDWQEVQTKLRWVARLSRSFMRETRWPRGKQCTTDTWWP